MREERLVAVTTGIPVDRLEHKRPRRFKLPSASTMTSARAKTALGVSVSATPDSRGAAAGSRTSAAVISSYTGPVSGAAAAAAARAPSRPDRVPTNQCGCPSPAIGVGWHRVSELNCGTTAILVLRRAGQPSRAAGVAAFATTPWSPPGKSLGVRNVVRPSGLPRLFISPGYRAGSSTLARRLLLSLRPGCCGVVGPVPSATLDKCPQRVRTSRM